MYTQLPIECCSIDKILRLIEKKDLRGIEVEPRNYVLNPEVRVTMPKTTVTPNDVQLI